MTHPDDPPKPLTTDRLEAVRAAATDYLRECADDPPMSEAEQVLALSVAGVMPTRVHGQFGSSDQARLAWVVASCCFVRLELPKNSVGNTQIKSNAVTSSKVKNGTLVAADFKAGVLSTLSGAQGAKGDTGAAGETGAAGPTGATGPTGPTASAYGVSNPVLSLSPGGAYAEVIRLTTASSASGPLVLPTAMRVFVMADVNAYKGSTDAATVGNLACRVRWAAVGGSFAMLAPLPSASFPNVATGTTLWQNLSVNAQVDLPAGRYDFAVQCSASNSSSFGTAPLTVYDVAMNVVAAAT